ncbi:hypothetical protein Anas_05703, partial [Armadillidium nasatum]
MNYLRKTAACGSFGTADLQTHFMREGALVKHILCIPLENLPTLLPDLSAELQLDQIQLSGQHDTLISITRIALQQQFVGDRINVKIEVETFCAVYDYRDLAAWLKYTPMKRSRKKAFPHKASSLVQSSPTEGISSKQALNPYCIGIILELWDVSLQAYIPYDIQSIETSIIPGIFLLQHSKNSMGMGEVAGEIVIETLVINLGNNLKDLGNKSKKNPLALSKRSHFYGTNASVGLCIVEFSSATPPDEEKRRDCFPLKIESLIDNVQLEWSNKLSAFVSCCQKYVKFFKEDSPTSKVFTRVEEEPKLKKGKIFSVDVKATALNLFLHTDSKVSVMVRVDLIKSSKSMTESKICVEGIKAIKFSPIGSAYQCIKSSEIMNEFLNLRTVTFEEDGKELHVTVGETLLIRWSTSLHRTLLLVRDDVKKFTENILASKKEISSTPSQSSNLKLQFVAKGDLKICARLSPRHFVDFVAGDFIYLTADGITSIQTEELKILFDTHEIFLFRESRLVKMKLAMAYWKVTFPYQYNFAQAFTEDFISIFKWLKKVHNHKPKPFTEDSPLPPDIIIQVTEYVFEVCDDPFEVKLRYNYELMEDEYHESCKRISALEKKIEETRKTNLQLSSGKIESLFTILQQKNSETYVKRSKKILFTCDEIERSLTSLKFYHDLTWEAESFNAAYGPCWEPAMSQFNLALCLINRPSLDPSLPLPWWDKMRMLFHGRLILLVDQMTLLLHASLDPYNTTEEMELTWNELTVDWTNANLVFKGDLNVLVRTASKYDDVRLMNLPNLKISVKLSWVCRGNPNDHHAVMQCAPDKVPEYSINQEHDSYRVFRSQSLKMNLGLETKSRTGKDSPIEVIFYGSTLRWFENLKFIISGVTRPTRRGILFKNTIPRKPQLSRHYQSVHLSLSFQRFEVTYWLSARVKKGFKYTGERLSLSSEHNLSLIPINDGLRHRPRTCWSISGPGQLEKFYFLNLTKVEYMRETLEPSFPFSALPDTHTHIKDTPNHRLVVHNLKGVWTTSNRDIVFAVYDSWTKSQQLKRNLAPDVIKSFTPGDTSTPQKPRNWSTTDNTGTLSPTSLLQVGSAVQNTPSPRTRLQSDHTTTMLQQLIAEADNNYIAYAEDCSTPEPRDQTLQGVKAACSTDDVIHKKWLIQLVNSQVLLKGCETNGYVIISAAKSQICQRIHRPAWRSNSLVTKATWSGSLDCMQYYATVSERNQNNQMDNIMWLTLDNIEEKDCTVINEVTDIVGSGQSVGGVVSQTVGISNQENESVQLQRIVSRCRCEFFYVNYGETGIDHTLLGEVYPPSNEEGLWNNNTEAADTFTLMHYDLCASTNYLQYNMVLDILNNLLLYIDPKKKEASEALARMRFKLHLYSREDQRKPIIQLQNQVRYHLSQLRFLEKEVYLIQRQMDKEPTPSLVAQRFDLECQAAECKEKKTYSDDITEHLLELGFINVSNLLPNQIYKDVLAPAELRSSMPVDRQKTLRIYCREKPPCGGIAILEHFEINVVPLKIELTYQFFKTMLKFCFPYNNTDDDDVNSVMERNPSSSTSLKKSNKVSNFYVDLQKDDVEIMKQRAEQNKHFVFIKIPELPVNLSYKGKKEKNIEDVHNSRLVVPTLEFHSVTWTWLDLLLAIKMGSKSALVSQVSDA